MKTGTEGIKSKIHQKNLFINCQTAMQKFPAANKNSKKLPSIERTNFKENTGVSSTQRVHIKSRFGRQGSVHEGQASAV